ncbi:MAG: polysaccharide export protein [Gammaproteobacteria bacterium]|nr:polysaccharide export protein [Gammaproteobacteria bacterium]
MIPAKTDFTLEPGDNIDVIFHYWPDLNDSQVIRPDGKISLQIVDDVQAAGLTPAQLDEHITKLYEKELKDPVITVVVREIAHRLVYIGGEVFIPGMIELQDKMTVLKAIMASGGFNMRTANLSSVVVIRHVDDKQYATTLNLKEALSSPENDSFYLAAQDIVFVPSTTTTRVKRWINETFPISRGLNIGTVVDRVSIGLGSN